MPPPDPQDFLWPEPAAEEHPEEHRKHKLTVPGTQVGGQRVRRFKEQPDFFICKYVWHKRDVFPGNGIRDNVSRFPHGVEISGKIPYYQDPSVEAVFMFFPFAQAAPVFCDLLCDGFFIGIVLPAETVELA